MKTKRAIELLMKADPSGELECVVDGIGIHSIEKVDTFAYGYGWYEVLNRDPERGHIVSGKITTEGHVAMVNTLSIEELLIEEGGELPVIIDIDNKEFHEVAVRQLHSWVENAKEIVGK